MNDLKHHASPEALPASDVSVRRRSLVAGCGAHAVHDGLTDVIYVPVSYTHLTLPTIYSV